MKRGRLEFWIRWKGSLAVKQANSTKSSGSITQSQNQLGNEKNFKRHITQHGFPKQLNLEDKIHSKWGRFVTAWFFPSLLCLICNWFEFQIWSFESFHMDLNTWVPLGFHPSASFPSLTIISSLVHLIIIFGMKNIHFLPLNPS